MTELKRKQWIIMGILILSILSILIGVFSSNRERMLELSKKKETIAVLRIEGPIMGGSAGGLLSAAGTDPLLGQIHDLIENKEVKALLLRINSPGGSSAASQEIYQELKKVKKSGKTIVVSMGDTCASGGYLVACAADKIVANPSTMTGSIGVIMPMQNVEELMKKIGIQNQTIKSSSHKDMGSSNRPMTAEEKKILQDMVDDVYRQFVDVVVEGRKLPREKALTLADGRIYTGEQAKKAGLVDELGNYYDALDLTKKLAGITGDVPIKEYRKKTPWDYLGQ